MKLAVEKAAGLMCWTLSASEAEGQEHSWPVRSTAAITATLMCDRAPNQVRVRNLKITYHKTFAYTAVSPVYVQWKAVGNLDNFNSLTS